MPQFHSDTDPPKQPVLQPPCTKCGMPMWLVRLSKYDAAHELHTFECQVCEHSENRMVKFK